MFALSVVGFCVLAVLGYNAISSKVGSQPTANIEALKHPGSSPQQASQVGEKQSRADYFASLEPRLPGLYHTASRYDEVTKAIDAPWPAACVETQAWNGRPARCRCLDQQGNAYKTTDAICSQIAHNGIFKDWQGKADAGRPEADRQQAKPQQSDKATVIDLAANSAAVETAAD